MRFDLSYKDDNGVRRLLGVQHDDRVRAEHRAMIMNAANAGKGVKRDVRVADLRFLERILAPLRDRGINITLANIT